MTETATVTFESPDGKKVVQKVTLNKKSKKMEINISCEPAMKKNEKGLYAILAASFIQTITNDKK